MSIAIGFIVHFGFFFSILYIQKKEIEWGKIPSARPDFLHFQHYFTTTWGYLLGLSLVDWFALRNWQKIHPFSLCVLGIFALVFVLCLHLKHSKQIGSNPNWAYPQKRKISLAGKVYFAYSSLQAWAVLVALFLFFAHKNTLNPDMLFAIAGMAFFIIMCAFDVCTKRWPWFSARTKNDP